MYENKMLKTLIVSCSLSGAKSVFKMFRENQLIKTVKLPRVGMALASNAKCPRFAYLPNQIQVLGSLGASQKRVQVMMDLPSFKTMDSVIRSSEQSVPMAP